MLWWMFLFLNSMSYLLKGICVIVSNRHHIWARAIAPVFLIVFIFLWPICFSSWVTVSCLDSSLLHNSPGIGSQLLWFCHTMGIMGKAPFQLPSVLHTADWSKKLSKKWRASPCTCQDAHAAAHSIGTIWRRIWWVTGTLLVPYFHQSQ